MYAPIREGHRGWQYPIPVTVTAEGFGLVEGVDFNFTDTVIEVPARVLDYPVPEGETDFGPPFCFNVTFYDNDLLTDSYEYVGFNFDLDVNTIESSYSMDVEVYDDEVRIFLEWCVVLLRCCVVLLCCVVLRFVAFCCVVSLWCLCMGVHGCECACLAQVNADVVCTCGVSALGGCGVDARANVLLCTTQAAHLSAF